MGSHDVAALRSQESELTRALPFRSFSLGFLAVSRRRRVQRLLEDVGQPLLRARLNLNLVLLILRLWHVA